MATTSNNPEIELAAANKFQTSINMNDRNREYIVYVAVPGMERKDISIKIKKGQLTISASRTEALHCLLENDNQSFYQWTESFTLPADADTVMTAAVYRNGELQIHIPKRTAAISEETTEVFIY